MVKKTTSGIEPHTRRNRDGTVNTISAEDHMHVFGRLARMKQGEMHGRPGERKKKSG